MHITHLNSLRALEATLRHGSFKAAAEELGVTPAAVGQRVRTLEEYLGRKLFERTAQGIVPASHAREAEQLLNSGFAAIAQALVKIAGTPSDRHLSVTLPSSFAENWLTPILPGFYRDHPSADLRLDASNRDVNLLTEDFDLAIRYGRPVRAPLQSYDLFGDYLIPICSPNFAADHRLTRETRSFEGVPLIHVLHRTQDPRWVGFDRWGAEFGFDPSHLGHGIKYSNVSSGLRSALSGQGLVLSGLTEAFDLIRKGDLVAPLGTACRYQTQYQYRLVWLEGRVWSPLQKDFVNWVREKARQFREDRDAYLAASV